ncbi:hypothetical protein KC316_g67 [Hortaea werneckii]|nr:hypothetical protein KC316_g67 [Hortaea werneckii]
MLDFTISAGVDTFSSLHGLIARGATASLTGLLLTEAGLLRDHVGVGELLATKLIGATEALLTLVVVIPTAITPAAAAASTTAIGTVKTTLVTEIGTRTSELIVAELLVIKTTWAPPMPPIGPMPPIPIIALISPIPPMPPMPMKFIICCIIDGSMPMPD